MKNKITHSDNEFPNLEKLKSKNGFETPTGYFDSLHNSIMDEVKEETKVKKLSFYKAFAYAATVLLIVGVSSTLFFSSPEINEEYEYVFESIVNYDEITVDEYNAEFTDVDLELDENLLFDEIAFL
ncbi:MAG: hypothetical protein ABF242_01550 [Flavobacteriales bacterium]